MLSAYECSGAERNVHLFACTVVVAECLATSGWHFNGKEGGYLWRVERVERGIDVPAEEAGGGEILGFWDGGLVEFLMMRVGESDVLETLIFGVVAVADDLDLRLMRDCFELILS